MTKEKTIVSRLNLQGKITEQHAKDIEEIIESIFQERRKDIIKELERLLREEMSSCARTYIHNWISELED